MRRTIRTPFESLKKTYRLQSTTREQIELFKTQFGKLSSHINEKKSEENVKNHLMRDFQKVVADGNKVNDRSAGPTGLLSLYEILSPTHLLKLHTATNKCMPVSAGSFNRN